MLLFQFPPSHPIHATSYHAIAYHAMPPQQKSTFPLVAFHFCNIFCSPHVVFVFCVFNYIEIGLKNFFFFLLCFAFEDDDDVLMTLYTDGLLANNYKCCCYHTTTTTTATTTIVIAVVVVVVFKAIIQPLPLLHTNNSFSSSLAATRNRD